ncbi:GNAT family N-acetyltransferase [Flaviaesturariibacter amylovorans]
MNIRNNTQNLRFEIELDGELAVLEYRLHGGNIMLMHTGVPDALGGRGIAAALALHAFEYAKAEGMPVVVYCPYVKVWLERHPEWKGLVQAP